MAQRNVLFVHSLNPLDPVGGAEASLISLVSSLDEQKFKALVALSAPCTTQQQLNDMGVRTIIVRMDPLHYRLVDKSYLERVLIATRGIASVCGLIRIILTRRVHGVCTNVQGAHLYGAIASWITRRPHILYMRDLPQGAFSTKLFPQIAGLLADHIIAISQAVERFFVTHPRHGQRCASKISLIQNGLNIETFTDQTPDCGVRQELQVEPGCAVVTMVGRLQAWKGQKDFLEAARIVLQKHPNARFLIVGDVVQSEPHFRDELVELAGQLGIGKSVVFTGHRSDIRAIFSITDIAVCASWYEPFGRVVAEAMAMAKPVIGTRAGGIPDIIVDGETGYLVNPRDPSSLAGGICAILTDRDKGREMGRLGRMRVLAHFDMVNVTRKVTRVFDLVFSGHRSAE